MKKIVFFSLEDGWFGGIASVNLALKPGLEQKGYEVRNLFLRGCDFPLPESESNTIIRKNCPWKFVSGSEILQNCRKLRFFTAGKLLFRRLADEIRNRIDFSRVKKYLFRENPDCIVVSHYYLLDAIPPSFLSRTVHHVHTAFHSTVSQKANRETLERFNGRIAFLWLSRNICRHAQEEGYRHSFYAYNPLSRFPEERTEAETKNTVSVITRFSEEKRLPLAVELVRNAMDALPDPNAFSMEFWGSGPEEDALRLAIGDDPRFRIMGQTKDPFGILKNTRFTVNTSRFEGFSISILEAAAAGVPTISFRFGEAAEEEILSEKTGLILPMNDTDAFVEAVTQLFSDSDLVKKLSLNAKEHAASFRVEEVLNEWESLLLRLPLDKTDNR